MKWLELLNNFCVDFRRCYFYVSGDLNFLSTYYLSDILASCSPVTVVGLVYVKIRLILFLLTKDLKHPNQTKPLLDHPFSLSFYLESR